MKEGWKYEKLGDICDILDSKRKPITKNKRVLGSIPYYGATGVLDYVKDFIFDEKLVLLGEDGAKWAAGDKSAYIISGKSWVNNHAHALRPNRDIITDEYLTYYLNFSDLSGYITGVTVPKLNQEKMRGIEIPIPPLPEQERIVSLLDAEFAKIDAIKANAEKQLQDAKALFQSALKDYLTPKEGWEEKTLGEIAADSADGPFGSNLKAVHYTTKPQVRIVQLSNIGEYGWKDENIKYTTFEHLKAISRSEVTPGDIVIAKMMPAGRAIICPNHEKKYVLSSDAVKIKLINGYNTKYILHYINSIFFNKQVLENVSGSGRIRTSLTKLRSYKLYIPDFTTQTNIANKVDYLLKIYLQLQSNFDTTVTLCNDLKQSILKDIFG